MVQYQSDLDRVFGALSDPTRRTILDRLGRGEATISELAAPTGISLTGVKKHVAVLEAAALIQTEKRGRARFCRLEPRGLDEAGFWIEEYRRRRDDEFNRLEEILKRKKEGQQR